MTTRPIVVLCPHFAPDTAPTGDVITTIVQAMVARGRRVHVVTALPWYRMHAIEDGWTGRPVRRERTEWGSIIRVHPFPGKSKRNLLRRAVGFALFSVLAGVCTLFAGGWRRRPAAVISMSPPLTLGLTGWLAARLRFTRCIFNIQDVFPDAAVETGAMMATDDRSTIDAFRRFGSQMGIAFQIADDLKGTFWTSQDRKSTRLNSSHIPLSRMPSSA